MKRHITALVLLLLTIHSWAQGTEYLTMLKDILSGSTAQKSMNLGFTADSLGHRRGLNPKDPEFDIDYFFKGEFEAKLSAELDMPSLYHQRNMLSRTNTELSAARYRLERLTLLAEISDCYLELVYNTKLERFLSEMCSTDSIMPFRSRLDQALEEGDITALDHADLKMTAITLTDAHEECRRQIQMLTDRIRMYDPSFSPGTPDFPTFPIPEMTREQFIENTIGSSPESDIWAKDSLARDRELKLARWEWAPKIVVGARLDMDENRNFAPAALAGLSIPLWENRNNIRHAKARKASAEAERERSEQQLRNELEQLYTRYSTSVSMMRNWDGYDIDAHASILRKAYSIGKLTASEYFLQISRLLENAVRIMGLEHEHAACAARMTILLNGNDI